MPRRRPLGALVTRPWWVCGVVLLLAAPAGAVISASLLQLFGLSQINHSGTFPAGSVAVAPSTTICNLGDEIIPWQAAMSPNHPIVGYSIYRLKDARLEQIGRSWAKHTFFVVGTSQCGSCISAGSAALGLACSDTYAASNNALQTQLGPREEVDPWTAGWQPCGSYFDGTPVDCLRNGPSGLGPLDHRCVGTDADLNDPAAQYFYEAMYLINNDADRTDNIGSRKFVPTWLGSQWFFDTPSMDNPLVIGPVIARWLSGGANELLSTVDDPGRVYVGSKATDLGGGVWHFEYAVYNLNYTRRLRRFTVSLPPGAAPANIGFFDGDGNAANDWAATIDATCRTIAWQTDTYAGNPAANALVWGTLFNFRFDATATPGVASAQLEPFAPGGGAAELSTSAVMPSLPGCLVGDVNLDGQLNGLDVQEFVGVLLDPPCATAEAWCAANVHSADAVIDGQDAAELAALLVAP
ncbi:MAG: hypothetical protein U1A27_13585 [Phycisphaerae bacterium]